MAKFYVSDVMERKIDDVVSGYTIVITCEGDHGAVVSNSVFAESKDIIASKAGITQIAENWLKEKDGKLTNAEVMAQKAVVVSEQQLKILIPEAELKA